MSETSAGHRTGDHFANVSLVGRGVGFDRARLTELVRTQDIGPTVLDVVGVQAPASCEGQSVMQLLKAHS